MPPRASDNRDLFHRDMVISTEPFSERQMLDLFTRVRLDKSLYDDFMAYSGGSPGVLGSLLKLTLESCQTRKKYSAWKLWFEAEGFARYVSSNYTMFENLHDEWLELTGFEWRFLMEALERRKNPADRLMMPRIRADLVEVEKRLEEATTDNTIASDSHQQHPDTQTDGYTRMCQWIRVKFLGIIADDLRRFPPSMPTDPTFLTVIRQDDGSCTTTYFGKSQ